LWDHAIGMLMKNVLRFAGGFFTFVVAHTIEAAKWSDWFHGTAEPWFLNSGRAVLLTIVTVGLTSAVVAALVESTPAVSGVSVAAGAFVAMTMVLFLKPGGPGTIFPIVLVVGGGFLLLGSVIGAWTGTRVRRVIRSRR
jgi:hypothetical protein